MIKLALHLHHERCHVRVSVYGCLAATLLATWPSSPLSASNYYVSPDGSDAGDGSAAQPWRLVQTGLNRVVPGDTLIIRPGTYAESLRTSRGGASAARITVRAETPFTVTISANASGALEVLHPYLTFQGLRFAGQYNGHDIVRVQTGADALELRQVEVLDGSRDGIDLGSNSISPPGPTTDFLHDVLIENATLRNLLWRDAQGNRQDAHGIVAGGVRNLVIRQSDVSFVSGDALQLQDGAWDNVLIDTVRFWNAPLPQPAGGFPQGVNPGENAIDTKQDSDINVRGRLTVKNSEFFGWNGDLIANTAALNLKERIEAIVDGNTFHDNTIALRLRGDTQDAGAHVSLQNNVLYDNGRAIRYEDDINHLHVFQNTFGSGNGQFFQDGGGGGLGDDLQAANNLFLAPTLPAVASGPGNVAVNSGSFVRIQQGDYHLLPHSPAVDAGITLAEISTDRDGMPRPSGQAYDAGAFEWRPVMGDMDCDSDIDFDDIEHFTQALLDPAGYVNTFGVPPELKGDADTDGDFDFDDTDDFIQILANPSGSTLQVLPEPPLVVPFAWLLLAVWDWTRSSTCNRSRSPYGRPGK
jgi:hypothetical protein